MIRQKVAQNKTRKHTSQAYEVIKREYNSYKELDRVPENSDTSHWSMQKSTPLTKGFIVQL